VKLVSNAAWCGHIANAHRDVLKVWYPPLDALSIVLSGNLRRDADRKQKDRERFAVYAAGCSEGVGFAPSVSYRNLLPR
jgi:hypothetical protein